MRLLIPTLLLALAAGCTTAQTASETSAADQPVAVYHKESVVMRRAGHDLSCTGGRIHVTTRDEGESFKAEGCGRVAAYVVECGEAASACEAVRQM